MANDLQLSRDVLAKFLPNHQAIKVFEQLTQMVGTDLPDSIVILTALLEELSISAGTTDSKADQALAALESIASSLDVLAKAPVPATQDDLQPLHLAIGDLQVLPRAELGTMAAQQAENVAITGGTISGVAISGTGFVVGPAGATDGSLVLFDGVTGELVKEATLVSDAILTAFGGTNQVVTRASLTFDGVTHQVAADNPGGEMAGSIYNTNTTTAGSHAVQHLRVGSGAAGSAFSHYELVGVLDWVVGVDTADNFYRVALGSTFAGTSMFAINPATGAITTVAGTLGSAAYTSSAAYDAAGAAAAAQAASQPLDTQLTAIAALADAAGLLTNNGAGAFSYSAMGANVLTFLATPSSANLAAALTDETGTGVAVFATSPTLVTPILGVAAATSVSFGDEALSVYNENTWAGNPTPAGGAFTTISFTGTWTRIGRRIMLNAVFHITDKGTAAGTLLLDLPYTPVGSSPIFGWEDNVVAKAVSGSSTGAQVEIRMVDGTTIYTNGANYVLFMSFDI